MTSPRVFFPYHTPDYFRDVPPYPWGRPTLLGDLDYGNSPEVNRDWVGETRLFLARMDIPAEVNYIGQYNARAAHKYGWMGWSWERLGEKLLPRLKPDRVLALWVTDLCPGRCDDWADWSERNHPGMMKLIHEMAGVSGRPLLATRSLWANDFVCHRSVWEDFVKFFRRVFRHFFDKYGKDVPIPPINMTGDRKAAYLYERIATHYFSTRVDLEIQVL